jgi:predicted neutral ceramidase superfamily lipid hydrolase
MNLGVRAALLAGIPLVIMTAIGVYLIAHGKQQDGRSTLAVGVIIASTCGSSVVYQVDQWSLPKQTLIHFLIMLVTVLPALLLSGWFSLSSPAGFSAAVGLFLAVGVVLWIVFYVIFGVLPARHGQS